MSSVSTDDIAYRFSRNVTRFIHVLHRTRIHYGVLCALFPPIQWRIGIADRSRLEHFSPLSAKNKKDLLPLEIFAPPFFLSSFLRSFRRFLYFTSFAFPRFQSYTSDEEMTIFAQTEIYLQKKKKKEKVWKKIGATNRCIRIEFMTFDT